jgi:hypothetical protein
MTECSAVWPKGDQSLTDTWSEVNCQEIQKKKEKERLTGGDIK